MSLCERTRPGLGIIEPRRERSAPPVVPPVRSLPSLPEWSCPCRPQCDARVLDRYVQSGKIVHAALLLLMLGARTTVTPFHHQPEAQHPKIFQLSTSRRPITPSLGQKRTSRRFAQCPLSSRKQTSVTGFSLFHRPGGKRPSVSSLARI